MTGSGSLWDCAAIIVITVAIILAARLGTRLYISLSERNLARYIDRAQQRQLQAQDERRRQQRAGTEEEPKP